MMTTQLEAQNILFVEDNDALRKLLARKLTELGYNVTAVGCYEDLDHMEVEPTRRLIWDIAILDVNLPGISGFEIAQILAEHFPRIKIIMLSVRSELNDRIKGYESGAINYLSKPIEFEELKVILNRLQQNAMQEKRQALETVYLTGHLKQLHNTQGMHLKLTDNEIALINRFLLSQNKYLDYSQIKEVLGIEQHADKNLMEVKISRLRKKLMAFQSHSHTDVFKSRRNEGYTLLLDIKILS